MNRRIAGIKDRLTRLPEDFAALRQRWPLLDRILATQERYTRHRGGVYAAGITYNALFALIPILMVVFAIAGFVLASQPELLDRIIDLVLENMPGELGVQVEGVINQAVSSRATVGVIGLIGAALTGIGWISLVRTAVTEMWGGRVRRGAVGTKLADLLLFITLGAAFSATMVLAALTNSGLPGTLVRALGFEGDAAAAVLRVVSVLISLLASTLLFAFVISRLPLTPVPYRVALGSGLGTAIAFEIIKAVGGIYLRSVLSSPAGAAFGSVIGVLVFAYLAARIILYATAWCASSPGNEQYRVVDYVEAEMLAEATAPVVVRPVAEVHPVPRPGMLAAAAGLGAAVTAAGGFLARWCSRRPR